MKARRTWGRDMWSSSRHEWDRVLQGVVTARSEEMSWLLTINAQTYMIRVATWRNGSAFGFDRLTVPKGCRFESCGGHSFFHFHIQALHCKFTLHLHFLTVNYTNVQSSSPIIIKTRTPPGETHRAFSQLQSPHH